MAEPRVVADWILQQRAGSGSFAVVWKAVHKDSGKIVAIKEISTDRLNRKLKQSLESEVSILKQIHHRNIVHLQDVFYLVMSSKAFRESAALASLSAPQVVGVAEQSVQHCRTPAICISSWSTALGATWLGTYAAASECQRSLPVLLCASWAQA